VSANLQNQSPILKEVYEKMAGIPPQFLKNKQQGGNPFAGGGNSAPQENPKAAAKKKQAAARLAMLKAKKGS
jgi:hypothetical protein